MPDGLGPQDGKHDQCFDGGICGDDSSEPGLGGHGGASGEPAGAGAGGAGSGAGGFAGSDPGTHEPGGDLLTEFTIALDRIYTSLCACQEVSQSECMAGYQPARECQVRGIEMHLDVAEPWLKCAAGALQAQADCLGAAACDPDMLIACVAPNGDDEDPITATCGEAPAALEDGDDCSGELPGDTGFPCFDGSAQVPAELVCNGTADCIDGSDEDESVCAPSGDEMYDCGDGQQIYSDWVCDGEADCTNGSDELECEGVEPGPDPEPAISCGDGSSVPLSWVCDGYEDCATGADEMDCASDAP